MFTKVEIARRQLGTALALFIERLDPVSVHVLACGAVEVLQGVAKHAGVPTIEDLMRERSHFTEADCRKARNMYWNAMKHHKAHDGSPRDDADLLQAFSEAENELTLFAGWLDYRSITGEAPSEADVFEIWYVAKRNPSLLPNIKEDAFAFATSDFDKFREMNENEQRETLKYWAKAVRTEQPLIHLSTDRRPLILS